MKTLLHLDYSSKHTEKLDVYLPDGEDFTTVVYFHGGGLVTEDFILGAFISFATPTAGLASTFSDTHDGDTESAVAFTLGSTILSIITIPLLSWAICLFF